MRTSGPESWLFWGILRAVRGQFAAHEILRRLELAEGVALELLQGGREFAREGAGACLRYLFEEMGKSAKVLKEYTPDIRMNKFSADVLEDTDYDRIKAELGNDFDFLEHEGNVVECVPKGTSKATGIEWLCRYLGVPREETYAIGDSINDLDMLEYVGHGIAMGNATQPPKDVAEFVTTDIHEDGIRNAMLHYHLI